MRRLDRLWMWKGLVKGCWGLNRFRGSKKHIWTRAIGEEQHYDVSAVFIFDAGTQNVIYEDLLLNSPSLQRGLH